VCLCAFALLAVSARAPAIPAPTVEQLLAHYQQARGGEQKWHAVQTLGWVGHVVAPSGTNTPDLSFLMLFKRPNATRFEIAGKGARSIRIFDGHHGWRVRPGSERGLDIKDYDAEELAAARDAGGLDGPLCDPQRKGISVELEGSDTIEGHRAWRLRLTMPSGQVQRHWIDARTYLELRYDRVSHDSAGHSGLVAVYYRNYRTFAGLMLPLTIETRDADGQLVNQMLIDKVAVNPTLDANAFIGPANIARHGGVLVDTTRQPGSTPAGP
jgi:outer membrane lipoprotein-sorting protein